jgi:hypothetical protein
MEMSSKLIPHNRIDVCMSVVVCIPPICCCPKHLVHGKKNFLTILALGDHDLLLYPNEPILGFHGILSLREGGAVSSHELSQMGLVRWQGWRCLLLVRLLGRLHVVKGLQYKLHQIILGGDQLLEIDGVVVGGVAGLAIALAVPCVHHLIGRLGTDIRFYETPTICNKGYM